LDRLAVAKWVGIRGDGRVGPPVPAVGGPIVAEGRQRAVAAEVSILPHAGTEPERTVPHIRVEELLEVAGRRLLRSQELISRGADGDSHLLAGPFEVSL